MVWVAKVKPQSPLVKSELACTAAIVKRGCTVHYLEVRRCGHFLSTNLPLNSEVWTQNLLHRSLYDVARHMNNSASYTDVPPEVHSGRVDY